MSKGLFSDALSLKGIIEHDELGRIPVALREHWVHTHHIDPVDAARLSVIGHEMRRVNRQMFLLAGGAVFAASFTLTSIVRTGSNVWDIDNILLMSVALFLFGGAILLTADWAYKVHTWRTQMATERVSTAKRFGDLFSQLMLLLKLKDPKPIVSYKLAGIRERVEQRLVLMAREVNRLEGAAAAGGDLPHAALSTSESRQLSDELKLMAGNMAELGVADPDYVVYFNRAKRK